MSSSIKESDLEVEAIHVVVSAHHLNVDLKDGRSISVPLAWYPRLAHGTPAEQANVTISAYGLHWEDLDEDISIKGLLLGHPSGESRASLDQWLACRVRGEKVPVPTYPLPDDLAKELAQ